MCLYGYATLCRKNTVNWNFPLAHVYILLDPNDGVNQQTGNTSKWQNLLLQLISVKYVVFIILTHAGMSLKRQIYKGKN